MKKYLLLVVLLATCFNALSQKDSLLAPYLKFPTIPPLRLLLADSSTLFTKSDLKNKKPVLVILFSPDCDHCKHETGEILKSIDKLKKIQIVMATTLPFYKMEQFYNEFGLENYDNIIVGQDIYFILPSFYNIKNFPYNAMYDKKGKLITTFEGLLSVDKILNTFE